MFSRFVAFAFALGLSLPAVASDPGEVGILKGKQLDATYVDHVLEGKIGGIPFKAEPLTQEFGMKLTHQIGGQTFQSVFRKEATGYAATVVSVDSQGRPVQVRYEMTGAANGVVTGKLNGVAFKTTVSAQSMNGHHYVDPTFTNTFPQGSYVYQIEGGQACMNCVVKLTFAVLSMLSLAGGL